MAPLSELTLILDRTRDVAGLANMASYYLILHFWTMVAQTESQIRLLSVIFGIATIVPVYLVARRVNGQWAALAAAALFAVSPTVIDWNQQARGYSLAMLVCAGLTLLLIHAVQRRGPWPWLAYGLIAAFGIYVHFFVGLVIAAHAGWVLVTRSWGSWMSVAAVTVPIAAASAPIPFIVLRFGEGHGWIEPLTFAQAAESLTGLAGSPILLVLLALASAVAVVEHRRNRWLWLVAVTALVPLFGIAALSVVKPFFIGRYLVVALPGVAMLAGIGISSARPVPFRAALAAAFVIATVIAIPSAYSDTRQEDWRAAGRYVWLNAEPDDRIYMGTWSARPMTYYLERFGGTEVPPRTLLERAMQDASGRLWIVFGDPGSTDAIHVRERLEGIYRVTEQRTFGNKVIVLLADPIISNPSG
jgi:mannosyltransferase